MRHIFIRFNEYSNYKLKFQFVKQGFEHLNHEYPGWKNNDYDFLSNYTNKPIKQRLMKSLSYWKSYILVPNFMHCFNYHFMKIFRKFLKVFKKYNCIKYAHAFNSKYSKIVNKAVLFESFYGNDISDSPFYMMKDLIEQNTDYKIYFATRNYEEHKKLIDQYRFDIKLV